jgi:hypothetical protein
MAFFLASGTSLLKKAAGSKINVQSACTLNMVHIILAWTAQKTLGFLAIDEQFL